MTVPIATAAKQSEIVIITHTSKLSFNFQLYYLNFRTYYLYFWTWNTKYEVREN